jgi:hypothetical protein
LLAAALLLGPAVLGGCAVRADDADYARVLLTLRPEDNRPVGQARTLERAWAGYGTWITSDDPDDETPTRELVVEVNPPGQSPTAAVSGSDEPGAPSGELSGVRRYTLDVHPAIFGRPTAPDAEGDEPSPVLVALDQPGASYTLTGSLVPDATVPMARGVARITFSRAFVDAAAGLDADAHQRDLLEAALLGLSARDLEAMASLQRPPAMRQAVRLAQAGLGAEQLQSLESAGYELTVDELIELHGQGVAVQDMVALREAGLAYDTSQLLVLHEQAVPAAYVIELSPTQLTGDLDAVVQMHQAGVEPASAIRLKQLGVANEAATQVRLHEAGVTPDDVQTLQDAGYWLNDDQLVMLERAAVASPDVQSLRRAGYDLTLAELVTLLGDRPHGWDVPADYAVALQADGYQTLPVQQIVDLWLRRVRPDMVQALREGRPMPGPPAQDGLDMDRVIGEPLGGNDQADEGSAEDDEPGGGVRELERVLDLP